MRPSSTTARESSTSKIKLAAVKASRKRPVWACSEWE